MKIEALHNWTVEIVELVPIRGVTVFALGLRKHVIIGLDGAVEIVFKLSAVDLVSQVALSKICGDSFSGGADLANPLIDVDRGVVGTVRVTLAGDVLVLQLDKLRGTDAGVAHEHGTKPPRSEGIALSFGAEIFGATGPSFGAVPLGDRLPSVDGGVEGRCGVGELGSTVGW